MPLIQKKKERKKTQIENDMGTENIKRYCFIHLLLNVIQCNIKVRDNFKINK